MSSYITKKTPGNTEWFTKDRFGMFIHWGLYAMPARHEWVKLFEEIPEEKYDKYFRYFEPDLFDPSEWAKCAKAAGMKYVVFTAKHHEGFCMWDSKYTDYKCTNTPIKRDLLKEVVDAFRKEGIRIGLYYSLLDLHHPEYPLDALHPRRRCENPTEVNKSRDMNKYVEYMKNQLTELMTNYGKIDILWFDFSWEDDAHEIPYYNGAKWFKGKRAKDWKSEELIELVRSYNSEILINNRAGIDQDLWTPEQYVPNEWTKHPESGELVVWEACQTFSGSWGYYRDEMSWKTPETLIEMLIRIVSQGGNLIMNVGPTSRGCFDNRAKAALDIYAKWMKYNSRAIYGCTKAEPEWVAPTGCVLTQSEDSKRLYIHLIEYPVGNIVFPQMGDKVDYAQFLNDGSEILINKARCHRAGDVTVGQSKDDLVLEVPGIKPNTPIPVIELFLK